MEQQSQLIVRPVSTLPTVGLRELLAVPFRRRKVVVLTFLATIVGLTVGLLLMPPSYTAEMKILVKRDRTNTPLSAAPDRPLSVPPGMTDQEVNSEVDLLSSQELQRKVVLALGLHQQKPTSLLGRFKARMDTRSVEEKIAAATQMLDSRIRVEPPNRSNLIRVTYEGSDPAQAANVLNTLAQFYFEKHLELHRQAGSVQFFDGESKRLGRELEEAKSRLREFNERGGVVSAELEKQNSLLKLSNFEGSQQETNASIASSEQRIRSLEAQAAAVPARMVTAERTPSALLEELNANLYKLEMKRTELLQKYAPTYRLVRDVEEQIATTRESMKQVEKSPPKEQTTDENPVYAYISSELAKEKSQLAALRARRAATAKIVDVYRNQTLSLDRAGLEQQTLLQAVKVAETSHQVALQKREEARMAEELDRQRIANVAIAEAAIPPALPESSTIMRFAMALLLASIVSVGAGFASDALDPSFRTPAEAESLLQVPVLAVLPPTEDASPAAANTARPFSRWSATGTD